ncbi:hypothetical protein [Halovenus salina]|uniref:Uncharacterized protein n=1 Tax=Halovenus salina TaxID=1510225 RepID=A0ABD5W5X8_9EURY|nr:hypothetical protein [Halovenus salina]
MVGEIQRTIAVWTVLLVPFVLLALYLYANGELTPRFVAFYWFPAAVLTLIGTLPTPWSVLQALAIPG